MNATLVSLYPLEFHEHVPFLFPSSYHIDASDGITPKTLIVGEAFYLVPNPTSEDMPPLKITKSATSIAESLVYDFHNSSMFSDEGSKPAIFSLPDEWDAATILKTHRVKVDLAVAQQKNWFKKLVYQADDDWQKFKQHKMISDLQRLAAKTLNLEREWMNVEVSMLSCPACSTKVNATQAVCHNCRCIINPEAYKNLKFAEMK